MTTSKKIQAIDLLRGYEGKNPYLMELSYQLSSTNGSSALTDFVCDYVIRNINTQPVRVMKTVKIADWLGKKLQAKYDIDFVPERLSIKGYLGDVLNYYLVYAKWRRNMDPIRLFLDKRGVITDFLSDDYHNYQVNFSRYNNLLHQRDPQRTIKPHQEEAVKFLLSRKKCILADDMGLGKSASLSVAAIEGNFDSVLIICPASLKTNWKSELSWFVPEKDITVIDGFNGKRKGELEVMLGYKEGKSGLTRDELLREAKEAGKWTDNRFVIVNFDILNEFYTPTKARTQESLMKVSEKYPLFKYVWGKRSLIIIDEAHNLSNSGSDRYSIVKNLIDKGNPEYVFLSTGTPITNHPDNYYNLLKLIGDPTADDWEFYMTRYCDARKFPAKGEKEKWTNSFLRVVRKPNWGALTQEERDKLREYVWENSRKITVTKGESNLDELREKTAHIYLRRVKEDLNGLPEKTIREVVYTLTPSQQAEYDKLWEEYEAAQKELDPEKEVNKDLLEGAIYRKYCSNQMVPHTEELTEKFISNGEKVVIMCCYDEELYTLRDHFGDACVIYNGKMNTTEKDRAKNLFMQDDSKKVFIGNIKAAGAGITLTSAHVMIFNNISFVPAENQQAMDRIYRIGQTKDVEIYFQLFAGTQYERMWETVLKKQMTIDQVIRKEEDK